VGAPMHSSSELRSDAFAITLDGEPAGIEQVLPGFAERDRVGVVVRHPCDAVGASTLHSARRGVPPASDRGPPLEMLGTAEEQAHNVAWPTLRR